MWFPFDSSCPDHSCSKKALYWKVTKNLLPRSIYWAIEKEIFGLLHVPGTTRSLFRGLIIDRDGTVCLWKRNEEGTWGLFQKLEDFSPYFVETVLFPFSPSLTWPRRWHLPCSRRRIRSYWQQVEWRKIYFCMWMTVWEYSLFPSCQFPLAPVCSERRAQRAWRLDSCACLLHYEN